MSHLHESEQSVKVQDERLARAFFSTARFIPYFLGAAAVGFLAIYILTRSGIFGQRSPFLLYIGVITTLLALVQIPLLGLARRNKGMEAMLWSSLVSGIFAVLLTLFWQGIFPLAIAITLIGPITSLRAGTSRRFFSILALVSLLSITGILYAEARPTFERLQFGTPASIAGITFLLATGLLLAVLVVIAENRSFKKLQSLLLVSFIIVVTIPTLMAAVLSAVGTYSNSQTQTFNTLKAVSNLKESQLSAIVRGFQNDVRNLQNNSGFTRNALEVLAAREENSGRMENARRLARDQMSNLLNSGDFYVEIMVLDTQGKALISTIPQNEGKVFENQLFFRQGTLRLYTGFAEVADFNSENFIAASPLYDADGRVIRGVIALRSDAKPIRDVMENTPGFESAETYLVDRNYRPVTKTRIPASIVSTHAALEAILKNIPGGQAVYENYENRSVLGYYEWFEPMQVAMISEIYLSTVALNTARALGGSAVIALIVISMAIAAVAITAHSIVHPITVLAQTTESFAAGKLSARAPVEREDEIGVLGRSYNQMASQLQEIIDRLEQRVSDRTRDLENQTFRLRMAAEIARDTSSAKNLGQLLERTARLIAQRFNFYHTGIFLLDRNQEYAVLAASSSETGKELIADVLRLRVGEGGIVGWVAATGEPRILSDTPTELTFDDNGILPGTHSEIALPLKPENKVIGVLDIQSDQLQAFSDDDIAILQIMADQLAAAIERTRLLQEVESSLKELESAYGKHTREGWSRLAEDAEGVKGYRFDNIRMEPVSEPAELEKTVLESGVKTSTYAQNGDRQTTAVIPIKLRGQTIGVISVKLHEDHRDDTISTIELVSERLASALESARLYEEARLRADREQSISQVTTAISSSTDYEEILQTTVREIGANLKDVEVTIQVIGDGNANRQHE